MGLAKIKIEFDYSEQAYIITVTVPKPMLQDAQNYKHPELNEHIVKNALDFGIDQLKKTVLDSFNIK